MSALLLQCTQSKEDFKLEELKRLETSKCVDWELKFLLVNPSVLNGYSDLPPSVNSYSKYSDLQQRVSL